MAFAKLDASVPGKLELFKCRLRSHSVCIYILYLYILRCVSEWDVVHHKVTDLSVNPSSRPKVRNL